MAGTSAEHNGSQRAPIPVLFEDNHLLVVIKPPGVPSQEDESGDPDMLTLLKEDLKIRHNKPGNVFLGLVHRLDRPVGGAMLFAKTSKAASRLSDTVRTREFGKTYIAVVHGSPKQAQATLKHWMRKDSKRNVSDVFDRPVADAKEAVLDYAVIASTGGLSLVTVKLHTGRSHQIRAQMSAIGCPLYGDAKYGASSGQRSAAHGTVALWSSSVSFPHPVSKEWLTFRSIPPQLSAEWARWQAADLERAAHRFDA
ncbi:RluA family pseudouridine synthase [Paenibacillus cellulosilyticus]|uniref:RNA pseudouridylate synthase n=1 Tax=Paenibacillus cellulosilyticus TaxID=375489 RepID=A0A2V2YW42_9BACL|nr:RluA family pseudouridine synthase [Paenibacillus cellulosilyticus]PWW05473.1 RluA family pseudouridine synthase [Paenibacillus cellulosilyticus]QKS45486.1 RluA family pseudouridine synthase [Paenibacillus cellulosilyticus]